MKTVRIFVASSIEEFKNERIFIGDYIQRKNEEMKSHGIQVKLYLCEDESGNYQPTYDRWIGESEIFIALIGNHIGEYTKHELFVANDNVARKIKRKLLILTSSSSNPLIPDKIKLQFEQHCFDDIFVKQVCQLLNQLIREIAEELDDEVITDLAHIKFKVSIPPQIGVLENAIIGNTIRGFVDQYHNEMQIQTEENAADKSFDAYITLLAKGFEPEMERIGYILKICSTKEKVWIFAGRENLTHPIKLFINKLAEEHKKYTFYYDNHKDFYPQLKCLLNDAFLCFLRQNNLLGGYTYVVEDHLLKRENLRTGNRFVIKNLASLKGSEDMRYRKERIIVNCLNIYHTTSGKFSKYLKALRALENDEFCFFTYDQSMIVDIQNEGYDAWIDYTIDLIETLQFQKEDDIQILSEINNNVALWQNGLYRMQPTDCLKINYLFGLTLFPHKSLFNEACSFFERAILGYEKIQQPDENDNEYVRQSVLILCQIYYEHGNLELILQYAKKGMIIVNKKRNSNRDMFYQFLFCIYMARAYRNINSLEANSCYQYAEKMIEKDFDSENYKLDYYIQLRYEMIMNQKRERYELYTELAVLEEKYNRFLSSGEYPLAQIYIMLLRAWLYDDISIYNEAESIANNNNLLPNDSMPRLDMLYVESDILYKKGRYIEATNILSMLINQYQGDRDKATCLQNKALCHMKMFQLKRAEDSYCLSLKYYEKLDDKMCIGNLYDGLSYCYILQGNFNLAERFSIKALEIEEYLSLNKYTNYVSALLCQKYFLKAFHVFYFKVNDKKRLRKSLLMDWNTEMRNVGIDTTHFNLLFLFYDIKRILLNIHGVLRHIELTYKYKRES